MRACLLILFLLLSTFTTGADAREKRFISSHWGTLNAARAAEQPAYEMLCRGGGMLLKQLGTEYISARDQPDEAIVTFELFFSRSLKAAERNGRGIGPGQCSWIDRPVNNNEPGAIRFTTKANTQSKKVLHGSEVDKSPTAAERYPDAQTIPGYMNDKNHYWSFFVYNTGKGYLLATSHRHFKPNIPMKDKIIRNDSNIRIIPKP